MLWFAHFASASISERVAKLEVEGNGILRYVPNYRGYLYLDDLDVFADSQLTVTNWSVGTHHLLVRKTGKHLIDSLNRIKFEGYWEWKAALKDYNRDYWQLIPGIPEPSVFGAMLTAATVGSSMMRRNWTLKLGHPR